MKLKYSFKYMPMKGYTVAVPVGGLSREFNGVLKLNETALSIMKLMEKETDEDALVKALFSQYEAEENVIREFVKKFVQTLKDEKFLDD